ncbi:hypothetical protein [Goodfellowiella coeruleoviolacea]|uniref:Uncharacterized protein n=1 Tax=Goodfellowiella coeruleoviolacea TaxID=334858 RepID=A0AAE3KJ43_9PSEU|nr:hypothetical protein [Goodfellowiella coeruleoviolacea]MCP2169190.1 hypothetical protein [Goodfellowiella coeruleoviolacea]
MTSNTKRFTDNLAPRLVATAATYDPAPAGGPARRAPLSTRAGERLGWVWADGGRAAGWLPDAATPAGARAGAYVWRVLAAAYHRGDPSSRVLDPALYAPLYHLGAPVDV